MTLTLVASVVVFTRGAWLFGEGNLLGLLICTMVTVLLLRAGVDAARALFMVHLSGTRNDANAP
jgi:hypothetical protein